jgi:hypothetical protein
LRERERAQRLWHRREEVPAWQHSPGRPPPERASPGAPPAPPRAGCRPALRWARRRPALAHRCAGPAKAGRPPHAHYIPGRDDSGFCLGFCLGFCVCNSCSMPARTQSPRKNPGQAAAAPQPHERADGKAPHSPRARARSAASSVCARCQARRGASPRCAQNTAGTPLR